MKLYRSPIEFEWDEGNRDKNLKKHRVTNQECEEVFFDPQKKTLSDPLHSGKEERFILIGQTKKQRLLFIVFTIRKQRVRIISARDLNKKEKGIYHA